MVAAVCACCEWLRHESSSGCWGCTLAAAASELGFAGQLGGGCSLFAGLRRACSPMGRPRRWQPSRLMPQTGRAPAPCTSAGTRRCCARTAPCAWRRRTRAACGKCPWLSLQPVQTRRPAAAELCCPSSWRLRSCLHGKRVLRGCMHAWQCLHHVACPCMQPCRHRALHALPPCGALAARKRAPHARTLGPRVLGLGL